MADLALRTIILGSRKSDLALWQAREVQRLLEALPQSQGRFAFEIRTEIAQGDVVLDQPLATLASAQPGIFTKELEVGLQSRAYDLAVHSLKDMPTTLPRGLVLAGVTEREDPRDALLVSARHYAAGEGGAGHALEPESCPYRSLAALPAGAVVGTSSLRREAVIRRLHPHLRVVTIRGNLNTRLRKLDAGAEAPASGGGAASGDGGSGSAQLQPDPAAQAAQAYDALVLAAAGVLRLGWARRIVSFLPPSEHPHAVGQGALGIECRADDGDVRALAAAVCHAPTLAAVAAERAFLNALQGGCQVPIGVDAVWDWWAAAAAASAPGGSSSGAGGSAHGDGGGDNDSSERHWQARSRQAPAAPADSAAGGGAGYPPVGTLSVTGTITALDGSHEVRAAASAPLLLPGGGGGSGGDAPRQLSVEQCGELVAAAAALGASLAKRALAGGAGEILGPLLAPRAATYGAAEQPLDR